MSYADANFYADIALLCTWVFAVAFLLGRQWGFFIARRDAERTAAGRGADNTGR